MEISRRLVLLAGLMTCAAAVGATAHGQDMQDKTKANSPPPAAPSKDEILVKGQRAEERTPMGLSANALTAGRAATADAHQFARCIHHVDPKLLRPVVEGISRDRETQRALDRVIRSNSACYPGYSRSPPLDYYGTCNPLVVPNEMKRMCRSTYDRGALIESAVAEYAPHFMLTRADTLDKEVIARFQAREKVRGKYRGPTDRRTYMTIACMVQMEPEKSIRLLRAEPSGDTETGLRERILDAGKLCTGSTARGSVDPFQFRGYLADALYHWTLAAKNVETLIPSS